MSDMTDNPADYEVGYGRPPKHTRFQPGRSGNVSGRRKKKPVHETDVLRILDEPVAVRAGNRKKEMVPREIALRKMAKSALAGDRKALFHILDTFVQHGVLTTAPAAQRVPGVIHVDSRSMPFDMGVLLHSRFGQRKTFTAAQRDWARNAYLHSRSETQAKIDSAIGYPDLQEGGAV